MLFPVELQKENILYCSELQMREYKEILKCSYGEDVDEVSFVNTLGHVLKNVTDKTNEYFLNEASILDVFCILIKLRSFSLGNEIQIKLDESKTAIIDIETFLVALKNANLMKPVFVEYENITIELICPTMQRLLSFKNNNHKDEIDLFLRSIQIKTNNDNQQVNITSNEQANEIISKLPIKLVTRLYESYKNYISLFYSLNFLSHLQSDKIKLGYVPLIEELIWYTKFLYNEPLDVLYSNIFYLAKYGNLSPDYIEKCSPGEYIYFSKQLENTLKETQPAEESYSEDPAINEDFEQL